MAAVRCSPRDSCPGPFRPRILPGAVVVSAGGDPSRASARVRGRVMRPPGSPIRLTRPCCAASFVTIHITPLFIHITLLPRLRTVPALRLHHGKGLFN